VHVKINEKKKVGENIHEPARTRSIEKKADSWQAPGLHADQQRRTREDERSRLLAGDSEQADPRAHSASSAQEASYGLEVIQSARAETLPALQDSFR